MHTVKDLLNKLGSESGLCKNHGEKVKKNHGCTLKNHQIHSKFMAPIHDYKVFKKF